MNDVGCNFCPLSFDIMFNVGCDYYPLSVVVVDLFACNKIGIQYFTALIITIYLYCQTGSHRRFCIIAYPQTVTNTHFFL